MANQAFYDVALRFVVGRLDVDRRAGVESGDVAFVQVDVLGCAVGGEHELLALRDHRIEDAEERVQRARFALQPLDVVDKQHVCLLEEPFEVLETLLVHTFFYCGVGIAVYQLHRVDVANVELGTGFAYVVLDSAHQMGFAHAGASVDEQGVQLGGAGAVGNLDGHVVGHAV